MTATSETYPTLREYRRRITAMLDDPECTGDLLSLGIALLDFAVTRTTREEKKFEFYTEKVWGNRRSRLGAQEVLRRDIRRYDALKDAEATGTARTCQAPMIRRQGPCGQSATLRVMLTDSVTGRKSWIAACRRHEDWFRDRTITNRAAVADAEGAQRPAANAGGVLARHIPEIDWQAVWVGLDPNWTPPPEAEPEDVPVVPKLRLVIGGADTINGTP